jgi:ABC-type glycerol-3-phosphate transport system substrate-binding protein
MTSMTIRVAAALAVAALLSACAEQPQESSASKGSAPSWDGAGNAYMVEGWKPGDQASWDEQMRRRAQAQNEYVRIGGAS